MKTFAEDGNTFIIAKVEEGESFKGDYYPRRIPNMLINKLNEHSNEAYQETKAMIQRTEPEN